MRASAWILQLDSDTVAAVGATSFRDFLRAPVIHRIPGAPVHCMHFTLWNDQVMPILDLARWLNAGNNIDPVDSAPQADSAVILRYQTTAADIGFGALRVSQLPVEQEVDDETACELPADNARYPEVALSCFASAELAVPILDVNRLFGQPLPI